MIAGSAKFPGWKSGRAAARNKLAARICLYLAFGFAILIGVRVVGCQISRPILFQGNDFKKLPDLGGFVVQRENENRIVRGYLVPKGKHLVVIFHGRGTTIFHESYPARKFLQNGFSVLLFEYPGYGISRDFAASEENYYSDAGVLLGHVQAKHGFIAQHSIAWGYSLGSGLAVEMAHRGLVSKLILLSPYTSIPDLVAWRTIPVVPHILIHDTFDSRAKAAGIEASVLIVHGSQDRTIPFSMAASLHDRFPRSTLMKLEKANHHLFQFMTGGHWDQVHRFMRR